MSAELPVVFLAFANAPDRHLATLKEESQNLFRALQPLEKDNAISVHREESAEFDELYQDLLAYDDRIVIFHYGGHADGSMLELEGGDGGAGGIAGLLGQQSSLKLVFLNGCATKDQVRLLHAAGVPAVIATAVKINDSKATELSKAFYSALASGQSIFEAFDSARGYVEGKFSSDGETKLKISRHPNFAFEEDDATSSQSFEFEWALYTREDSAADLEQWRLPEAREGWQTQLADTRGMLRDLDGEPVLIDHRTRARTVDAIHCSSCSSISSLLNQQTTMCPVCGSDNIETKSAKTEIADQALPFLIDESAARKQLVKYAGVKSLESVCLTQVFLPYWTFTVDARTTLEAERGVNQALAEVAPKLEWTKVKDTIELAYDWYLVPAAAAPAGANNTQGDWYWELDKAESPKSLPLDNTCVSLDLTLEHAFSQFSAQFDHDLEAEVAELVGGHQQRNITTDTRYQKVFAGSILLPHWFAVVSVEEGRAALVINGQTGAVRSLHLPGTVQLNNRSQANMAKRIYEPSDQANQQQAGPSRAISVFSGAGIGLMVGAMLGLAMSPTVATFVGAIGAALAALLGLNDRHFSYNKGLRIGAFGLFALVGAAAGMYAKEHRIFAPNLAQQKKEMIDAGFSDCQAQDLLSGISLRVLPTDNEKNFAARKEVFTKTGFTECQALHLLAGRPSVNTSSVSDNNGAQKISATDRALAASGLMSSTIDITACDELNKLSYPPVSPFAKLLSQFQEKGNNWKAFANSIDAVDKISDEGKTELLYIARNAVCRDEVKLSERQCEQAASSDDELQSLFGSAEELKLIRRKVNDKIDGSSEQNLALTLLSTKALCKSP